MQQPSAPALRVVDSIAELLPEDAGCVVVSGSHGGASAARYAMDVRPVLCVFNDAGVGLDRAGLAALELLQRQGLAACTVSHLTARIGDGASTLASGVISHSNASAMQAGLEPGRRCREAVADFRSRA